MKKLQRELELTLRQELSDTTKVLQNRFPYVPGTEFTPKRNNKRQGYVEGATFQRLKDFNPSSREHIAWILTKHDNFQASQTTSTGKDSIDETILAAHGTTLALTFLRILELTKILGMMSEGANAWLKLVTKSRLHHHCSIGCATFRCSHRNPNLAQVPGDLTYRRLFTATPGQVMVGADLSGIELRMLSHYLARYDTYFGDNLLNGDIHQLNADKIGITRKLVKTVTYAFLYGAGNEKIGYSYDRLLSPQKQKRRVRKLRKRLLKRFQGLMLYLVQLNMLLLEGMLRASTVDQFSLIVHTKRSTIYFRDRPEL